MKNETSQEHCNNAKFIVGCEEWCGLPDLGIPAVKARVDSGAKTSSIHAFDIYVCRKDGKDYVKFKIHPVQDNVSIVRTCYAPLVDTRVVKSSNGMGERRLVIVSKLKIGKKQWSIEMTLTNRDAMGYRMLLGREAMKGRILVDPERSFVISKMSDVCVSKLYQKSRPLQKRFKIAVLASDPKLYSNFRLMESGRLIGHEMHFVNITDCYVHIEGGVPNVRHHLLQLSDLDAVIPRIRPSLSVYGYAILRQFELMGILCHNRSGAIARARDKLRCLQVLKKKGIQTPITSFGYCLKNVNTLVDSVGGMPVVIKTLEGSQGRGVALANDVDEARRIMGKLHKSSSPIILQQFIKESRGRDIRCFVVDGKVVAAIQRISTNDDFRANLHLGGQALKFVPSSEERKIAIGAAKVTGLRVAGVDMVRSDTGPKVLEVNASPGLRGIEETTGIDIASTIVHSVEKHLT